MGQKPHDRLVQIVKELDYLADNVSCTRLSDFGAAVNDKTRCGTDGSDGCAEMRDRALRELFKNIFVDRGRPAGHT